MTTGRATTAIAALCAALAVSPLAAQRGPAPESTALPAEVLAAACAPAAAAVPAATPLRVTGGQDSFTRRVYIPGDLVTINAGAANGIEVGQQYFVRRVQAPSKDQLGPGARPSIHTAGWIRVYAVDDTMSLATIVHACDVIEVGDYLEPFAQPQVPVPSVSRSKPERGNYGRVMTGADRRRNFGKGDYVLVDQGADHGVTPGMTFVIYRDKGQAGNFLYELGEATAVDVKETTATVRVTLARDAIREGDYVAMRR